MIPFPNLDSVSAVELAESDMLIRADARDLGLTGKRRIKGMRLIG